MHNAAIDEEVALLGGCGQVHLQSGRICTSQHGHDDSCDFTPAEQVVASLTEHKSVGGW